MRKESNIILRLAGGFGNQLFQLTALANFINRFDNENKLNITIDPTALKRYATPRDFSSQDLFTTFLKSQDLRYNYKTSIISKIRYGRTNIQYIPNIQPISSYEKLMTCPLNSRAYMLDGYFQNEHNTFSQELKSLLQSQIFPDQKKTIMRNKTLMEIIGSDYTLLHVRRQDYLTKTNSKKFNTLSIDYYLNAVPYSPSKNKLVITGDDQDFCECLANKIGGINLRKLTKEPWEDFNFILNANFLILSNSTFCWQGYQLSQKCTAGVGPRTWFVNSRHEFHLASSLQLIDT